VLAAIDTDDERRGERVYPVNAATTAAGVTGQESVVGS